MKLTADDFQKVTVTVGKATHVTNPQRPTHTLCGRRWWFECVLGTGYYCVKCQTALAKIYTPTRE